MSENREIQKDKLNETAEITEIEQGEKSTKEIVEGEFKVTVRKLEMPVQPRGVLAE